jgi:serine/threonine protein kinase
MTIIFRADTKTNRNQFPNFQIFVFSGGAENVTVSPSGGGTNNKQNTVVGGVVTTSTAGEDKPKSPCQVSMEDFDLLKVLGTGAYGKVFLARKKTGANAGQLFAMKVLKKQTIVQKRKTTEHTKTERQVLATIRQSPFLVTMHYAFQTPSKLHLVLGMLLIFKFKSPAFFT